MIYIEEEEEEKYNFFYEDILENSELRESTKLYINDSVTFSIVKCIKDQLPVARSVMLKVQTIYYIISLYIYKLNLKYINIYVYNLKVIDSINYQIMLHKYSFKYFRWYFKLQMLDQ